jgi:hypothetical protein
VNEGEAATDHGRGIPFTDGHRPRSIE